MGVREILERVIFPEDPVLARRINALLWSYERGRLRHSLKHDPLTRARRDDDTALVRPDAGPLTVAPVTKAISTVIQQRDNLRAA